MLFRLLSNLALTESHADLRLLIAFFGACFILFFIGRFVSGYLLKMKPVETAIFGTGCVFSNNGLLGLPLAIAMLGEKIGSFGICGIVFKRLGVVDLGFNCRWILSSVGTSYDPLFFENFSVSFQKSLDYCHFLRGCLELYGIKHPLCDWRACPSNRQLSNCTEPDCGGDGVVRIRNRPRVRKERCIELH